jgi:hypothetical protein
MMLTVGVRRYWSGAMDGPGQYLRSTSKMPVPAHSSFLRASQSLLEAVLQLRMD